MPSQLASSYRPIALTSCLCKLIERMVVLRLTHHLLEKNQIISSAQSGFRPGRTSADPLTRLVAQVVLSKASRITNNPCLRTVVAQLDLTSA
jgi:hypothetical protein